MAGFALAANAFMIPSVVSLSKDAVDDFKALDISSVTHGPSNKHNVQLACPGCSFPSENNPNQEIENAMVRPFN